jgi:hypothetical protein
MCANCKDHGPISSMQAGLRHIVIWHEDGHGSAAYDWSAVPLRKSVALRRGRDGGVVPVPRGRRRKQVISELASVYPMVEADRRGLDGMPVADIATQVYRLVSADGLSVKTAIDVVAREHSWASATVRDRLYREPGKRVRATAQVLDEGIELLDELIRDTAGTPRRVGELRKLRADLVALSVTTPDAYRSDALALIEKLDGLLGMIEPS